jgi:hypothetical protein
VIVDPSAPSANRYQTVSTGPVAPRVFVNNSVQPEAGVVTDAVAVPSLQKATISKSPAETPAGKLMVWSVAFAPLLPLLVAAICGNDIGSRYV